MLVHQLRQDRFVLFGGEIGKPGAPSGRDQEVAVERNRALLRRPGDEPGQLIAAGQEMKREARTASDGTRFDYVLYEKRA